MKCLLVLIYSGIPVLYKVNTTDCLLVYFLTKLFKIIFTLPPDFINKHDVSKIPSLFQTNRKVKCLDSW